MDILTEDMKKELKDKFNTLDINDEHFQEKAQDIIDEAILGNKDKIGVTVVQKTIDEALEEEKEGFDEVQQLKEEGVWEYLQDQDLKDALGEQADQKIWDEADEKVSLEAAGFLKEPSKEATVEDIVEEILKQLEEVIEEKKQEVEKKIQKNEDMLGKVQKREQLRAAKVKVGNLHQKTKNYKGNEGKRLNQNVEAAITDLDKQIDALVVATTVNGHELQSDALKQERQKLTDEKKKLEDMSKFLRDKYTMDHSKEASKLFLKEEIRQKMEGIEYGMGPNKFIKQCEGLKDLYYSECEKGNFTPEEVIAIFEKVPLNIDRKLEFPANAFTLSAIGQINDMRRRYMVLTSKEDPTKEEKVEIEEKKKYFEERKKRVEAICDGREVLPLQTEDEYIEELEDLQEDAEEQGVFRGRIARDAASKARALRLVLREVLSVRKTNGIPEAYARLREILGKNKSVKTEDLPKELMDEPVKKKKEPVVEKVPTPMPKVAGEGYGDEERISDKSDDWYFDETDEIDEIPLDEKFLDEDEEEGPDL